MGVKPYSTEQNEFMAKFRMEDLALEEQKQKKRKEQKRGVHDNGHATATAISSYDYATTAATKSTYDGCYFKTWV